MRTSLALVALLCACGGAMDDGAETLGMQQLAGYRIDAAASLTLDASGFGVTAASVGRFRIVWQGSATDVLEGKITTDGQFDPTGTSPLGGKELVANQPDLISFRLNPTADLNGLDLVTSQGPIYLDLVRNGDRAATPIAFLRGGAPQRSAHDPVAIDVRVVR